VSPSILTVSLGEYRRRFRDPAFGLDLADIVAARHGLATPLVRKPEGSSLVFRTGDGQWLKISPPFFDDAFETEVRITGLMRGRLPVPIPEIVLTGELDAWRYLVSTEVPGVQVETVLRELTALDLERVADELGSFMAAFQQVAARGFERSFGDWPTYLDETLDDPVALHLNRGETRPWAEKLAAFTAAHEPYLRQLGPPVLIHADLTTEHVMLRHLDGVWRLAGVLDLADAMIAPAEMDLIAPCLGPLRGHAAAQRRLMRACRIELAGPARAARLMAVALQHRFVHFHDWFRAEIAGGLTDVAAIAEAVFPF
jgi:hygromycin-B 7''-O-kinase